MPSRCCAPHTSGRHTGRAHSASPAGYPVCAAAAAAAAAAAPDTDSTVDTQMRGVLSSGTLWSNPSVTPPDRGPCVHLCTLSLQCQ
jgi:hypothetical protein